MPRGQLSDRLDALLRGEETSWEDLAVGPTELLDVCGRDDLSELVHRRVAGFSRVRDWPDHVRRELEKTAHASAAGEIVRRNELVAALDALAAAGVHPILFKGAPLAYTVYEAPSLRARRDTDLFIRRDEVETVRRVMVGSGYEETLLSGGELVMCQFELARTDRFGLTHALDFHWKISTQPVFADLLTWDDLVASVEPVPALGPHARAAGRVHALLVACLHPVMHHRNVERPIWIYDLHLLISRLSDAELDAFADLAIDRRAAVVCARQLALARARFGTAVPPRIVARLEEPQTPAPSEAYLQASRRWHHELLSSLRGLDRLSDRLRLLREVLFPNPRYMVTAYGFGRIGAVLLPALYVHRIVNGVWKIARGRK